MVNIPTARSTPRCLETAGCGMPSAWTRSLTACPSLAARTSMICRRLGSAIALNTSDVVAARGMREVYTHIGIYQAKNFFGCSCTLAPFGGHAEQRSLRVIALLTSCLLETNSVHAPGGTVVEPRGNECAARGRRARCARGSTMRVYF